jgi:sugar lactone lactonase YvrE
LENNDERKKHMKTVTKFIYPTSAAFLPISLVFAVVALAMGALTANAAPGDLYEADDFSGTIFKFTPSGTQSTFASGLSRPVGLAFDSGGNLFEGDFGSGTIFEFTPGGTKSTFASGVDTPDGMAFDSAGNLYVATFTAGTILKFTSGGTQSTFASGLGVVTGLAFDSAGNLYAGIFFGGTILKFTPAGTQTIFASGLNDPEGLAFDSAGNLYEADFGTGNIYKFTPGGVQSTFASGAGQVVGLAFDSAGNLFAADWGGSNIFKFTPSGTKSTFTSGVNHPQYLAFEPTLFTGQIQQPINADGTSVFNVRRGVVPVKFTLTQGGVATCTLPPATIAVTRTAGGTIGAIDESIYTGSADTGSNFRIDNCQYVYNLSSGALGVGTYRVDIMINGQVVGSATFQLK